MGTITDRINRVWRDFVTDGVPASGVNEVDKSDARTIGPLIESAIASTTLGSMLDVIKTTRALLDADLAWDANSVALVYADATDANNDFYVKTGASGAGAWTLTPAFRNLLLAAGARAAINSVPFATWASLSAASGAAGDRATVRADDVGTHTDPVVGGTVNNSGNYIYSASPAGWRRVTDLDSQIAKSFANSLGALQFRSKAVIAQFYFDADGVVRLRDNQVPSTALASWDYTEGFDTDPSASFRTRLGLTSALVNPQALRETRRVVDAILNGVANSVHTVIMIGDSYTDITGGSTAGWTPLYANRLRSFSGGLGNSGPGFVNVPKNDTRFDYSADRTVAVTRTGAWTLNDPILGTTSPGSGPALSSLISTTSGNTISYSYTGGLTLTSATLHFQGGAGSIQYRYNGGSWTTVALSGSGYQTASLGTPPAGNFTLDVQTTTTSSTEICGARFVKSGSGVVVDKLGCAGTRASHWAGVGASNFQAGLTAIGGTGDGVRVEVMLGTNDVFGYDAATFVGHLTTLVGRIRSALPLADIMFLLPPRPLTAPTYEMVDYDKALRRWCVQNGYAYLNLQPYFGAGTSQAVAIAAYGSAALNYINETVDPTHGTARGCSVISAAKVRAVFDSI